MDVLNDLSINTQCLSDCFDVAYNSKSMDHSWEVSRVQEPSTFWSVAMRGGSMKESSSRTGSPNENLLNDVVVKQDFLYHKKTGVAPTFGPLAAHPHIKKCFNREWTPSTKKAVKKEMECSLGESLLDWVVCPNGLPYLRDHSVESNPGHMFVSNDEGDNITKDWPLDENSSAIQSYGDDKLAYLHGDESSKQGLEDSNIAYACATSPIEESAAGSLSSSETSISNNVSSSSEILNPVMFDQNNFLEYATHGLEMWFEDPFPNGGILQPYANDGNFIDYPKEEPMVNDKEELLSCGYGVSEAAHSQELLAHTACQQGNAGLMVALNEGIEVPADLRIDFEDSFVQLHNVAQDGSALSRCTQFCPPKPIFGADNNTMQKQHVTNDGVSASFNGSFPIYTGAAENKSLSDYAGGSRQLNNMYGVDTAYKSYVSEGSKAVQKVPKSEESEDVCRAHEWGSRSASDIFSKFDVRMKNKYTELGLVQLLTASAEAVVRRDMASASVMMGQLKDMVSSVGNTMQRVVAYFIQGIEHQIEGVTDAIHAGNISSQGDILAAFQILHEIFPYIKFGHFTANQAILEAIQGAKRVQIVDFEIMEGIQWSAFMQALATRKGGPPELRITALCRPHQEHGLAMVQKTGKRLSQFAAIFGLSFSFSLLETDHDESFDPTKLKRLEGEALVVNCMVHLPHMPQRSMASVASFLRGMHELSPTVVTLVEEELGCNTSAAASYFSEALYHFHAICESLEVCLPADVKARMLVEKVFMAPRIDSVVSMWSRGTPSSFAYRMDVSSRYKWSTVMHSAGLKPLRFSYQSHSQAKLLLGLHREGFCLEERSHYLVLGWQSRPLFVASVWN